VLKSLRAIYEDILKLDVLGDFARAYQPTDEGVRKALAIEIDTSLRMEGATRLLEQLKEWRGLSQAVRFDNGLEYNLTGARGHQTEHSDCGAWYEALYSSVKFTVVMTTVWGRRSIRYGVLVV